MMLGRLHISGHSYQGLEIFEVDGLVHYAFLKLKRSKGELELIQSFTTDTLSDLASYIDPKKSLWVQLNTSRVLNKPLGGDRPKSMEQWVKTVFPNLDLEQFYFQIMDWDKLPVVSITKRSVLEGHLAELKKHGWYPAGLSLGVAGLSPCMDFLEPPIQGSNFLIVSLNDGSWNLSPTDCDLDLKVELNGLQLPTVHLLSFSHLLGSIQGKDPVSNLTGFNQELQQRDKNKRLFQIGLQWGLGFLLALLLVNFLLFSYYRTKTLDSNGFIDPTQQASSLKQVRERVEVKKKKLQVLLGSSNSRATDYLDQIAAGLPESILLDILTYQPLTRPIQPDKPISLGTNQIIISGQTNNKIEFSGWTSRLESMEWVQEVEIERYEYTSSTEDNFSIKLYCHAIGQTK
ncbi:hypothetical protein [Flagellimonas sp. C4]|uniref:hypothetical protein n=1 Tax=Flagellimonas alginolytica TaxID=3177515 RepID=UPI0035C8F190